MPGTVEPPTSASRPRVVAHRGVHAEARGGARENTMAAVMAAVEIEACWVEVDVRVTADGAVVLLHDESLERLWGDDRTVAETPLTEVLSLGHGNVRIPLLSDVLDALDGRGVTLLIDMDDAVPALPAHDVVATSGADVPVAWCGAPDAMARIRDRDPVASTWSAWYSVEPPTPAELEGVSVLNVQHVLVGAEMVRVVHEHGAEIAVWTVDDGGRAAQMCALGVDSITTNEVEAIRRQLCPTAESG